MSRPLLCLMAILATLGHGCCSSGNDKGKAGQEQLQAALRAPTYGDYLKIRERGLAEISEIKAAAANKSLSIEEKIVCDAWIIRSQHPEDAQSFDKLIEAGRKTWQSCGMQQGRIYAYSAWGALSKNCPGNDFEKVCLPLTLELALKDEDPFNRMAWLWTASFSRADAILPLVVHFYTKEKDDGSMSSWSESQTAGEILIRLGRFFANSDPPRSLVDEQGRPIPVMVRVFQSTSDSDLRCRILGKIGEIGDQEQAATIRELVKDEVHKDVLAASEKALKELAAKTKQDNAKH